MRAITFFLSTILGCSQLFAQDPSVQDKQQLVYDYYGKGVELRKTDKDSSYYYFEKALGYAKDLHNYSDALELLISSMLTSGRHYDLKKFDQLLGRMEKMLHNESVRDSIPDIDYYDNRFTYERANYLYKLKDYSAAKPEFLSLYNTFMERSVDSLSSYDYTTLIHTNNFLALIYMNTDKYDLSETYFNRSLELLREHPRPKSQQLQNATLHLLAKLYTLTGRYDRADKVLTDVLTDFKKAYSTDKKNKNSVLAAYGKLVRNNIARDSLQTALEQLHESEGYLLEDDPFQKELLWMYGDIYTEQENFEKARGYFLQALADFLKYRNDGPHQDVAEAYGKLVHLSIREQDYMRGLQLLRQAFNHSGEDIEINSMLQNPDPDLVFSKHQLLYLLDLKIQLLQQAYGSTGKMEYLDAAVQTDRDLLNTFDLLKMEFDSKLDKQFLAENAYPLFHRMLEVAHEAYRTNPSSEILQLALGISERNKDFLLLEALRSTNATQYGGVPKEVLDREAQYRTEIAHLEQQLFESADEATNYSEPLFELKQEYHAFLDSLKNEYPKYHDLRFGSKTLNLAEARNSVVGDDGTLISYVMAQNHLYAIVMGSDGENFLKLPFDKTDKEAVRNYYKMLSRPSLDASQDDFLVMGKELYNKILGEPLKDFDSDNLTIIADDVLHYLPFEMLVKNRSYFLEDKTISYGNSVSSLLELRARQNENNGKLLAFAPSFDDEEIVSEVRFQFGKLLYNDDEVGHLDSFYDSEIYLDEKATLENFKKSAPEYEMIHLATHASANDEYPDYSYLAFGKQTDSSQINILYIKDLYNTNLNADMVVLSACQTGIGKLQKGQGMLSLSKGFYYAGAKSLINSLWKINDKSTVALMEFFYEGLSKGQSKKEALRNAKLQYLRTVEDDLLRHPYYWSAFVVSGDTSPITQEYFWWYAIGGVLLLAVLFFLWRKK